MRNILFFAGLVSMTACGLSEDAFNDQALSETCRILVLCELYADEAECEGAVEPADTEGCTYDASAAQACLDELAAVTECPTEAFASSCETAYTCESMDSGM